MSIRLRWLALVFAAGFGGGCAHNHVNPFLEPQDRIYGSVKTIALSPIVEPKELAEVDPGRGHFDSLITQELQRAGFVVVAAESSRVIWRRVVDSLGGLYDAATGERDSIKLNTARAVTMAELQARFRADAWLHPGIIFVDADFDGGTAHWDGASQGYQSFGKKLLLALVHQDSYGNTSALSLWVDMEDMHGKDLYVNQGGLQLYEIPHGRKWEPIQPGEVFADPTRNANAVHLALKPLVTRTKAASASP